MRRTWWDSPGRVIGPSHRPVPTQQTQETKTSMPRAGFETSSRAAADRPRQHGHRHRQKLYGTKKDGSVCRRTFGAVELYSADQ
jgi:hypothetical protein